MSIQMENGTSMRLVNQAGKEPAGSTPPKENQVTGHVIEIDTNNNGVFGDKGDVVIDDPKAVAALTDKKQGNFEDLKLPGVNREVLRQIDKHQAQAWEVKEHLNTAKEKGQQAEDTSFIRFKKKIRLGKEAMMASRDAFNTDPGNSTAKVGYSIALTNTLKYAPGGWPDKNLGFKEQGTTIAKEANKVISSLMRDKNNITSQLAAKALLELCLEKADDPKFASQMPASVDNIKKALAKVDANIEARAKSHPEEYQKASANVTKWLGYGAEK